MKKIFTFLLVLLLSLSLFGCEKSKKEASPSSKVNLFILATKVAGKGIIKDKFESKTNGFFEGHEDIEDEIIDMLLDFTYTIDSEVTNEDDAIVTATFNTYDFTDTLREFVVDYIALGLKMAISGSSKEEIQDKAYEILNEKISIAKENGLTYTKTIDFNLIHDKEKGWTMNEEEAQLVMIEALTGGLYEAYENIKEVIEQRSKL